MPGSFDISDLANRLTQIEFETLVQTYVMQHTSERLEKFPSVIVLTIQAYKGKFTTWEWQVGAAYGSEPCTKGPVLAQCLREQSRRESWQKSMDRVKGKLTGGTEASPLLEGHSGEIPF